VLGLACPGSRSGVVGGLAAGGVEADLEAGIALDRRGQVPAEPVATRTSLRVSPGAKVSVPDLAV